MSDKTLFPYIRGTKRKYGTAKNGGFWGENGYNCIEVGYLELGESTEVIDVIELIPCADVVSVGRIFESEDMKLAMDCVGNGYMRLFSRSQNTVRWDSEQVPLSSMELVYGKPMETIQNETS